MTNSDSGSGSPDAFVFYNYNPSMAAACIFIVIFALSSLFHSWQILRNRTWYFIPFLIGALFETVGYIGRALSAQDAPDFTKNPYIMQSLLLLLGPALLAASIYMVLGRLINLLNAAELSLIRPQWQTKVFVTGDVLSFLAQSGGGAILATAKTSAAVKKGENVILCGLGIQVLFFGFFIAAIVVFHTRILAKPTQRSYELPATWKSLMWVLYATSILIMVRSIFRIAEYVTGQHGALQSHEFWIYIFDAMLMALVCVLFNGFHPSRVLSGHHDAKRIASSDGYLMESQVYEEPSLQGRMSKQ